MPLASAAVPSSAAANSAARAVLETSTHSAAGKYSANHRRHWPNGWG